MTIFGSIHVPLEGSDIPNYQLYQKNTVLIITIFQKLNMNNKYRN